MVGGSEPCCALRAEIEALLVGEHARFEAAGRVVILRLVGAAEVVGVEHLGHRHRAGALHDVQELAHIAGPQEVGGPGERGLRDGATGAAATMQEGVDERTW